MPGCRPLLFLLSATMIGCAAVDVPEPPPPGEPLPYRLVVARPEVVYQPKDWNEDPSHHFSVKSDPRSLQGSLREAFAEARVFEDVETLGPATGERDPMLQATREGAKVLLETRVCKRVATYLGRNVLFYPNMLLWGVAWLPSWWIKDERYALELEAEVTLRSLSSGLRIYTGVHQARVEANLDDFQRGWQLLGIFRVPASLGAENWRAVDRSLASSAEAGLAREVTSRLGESIRARRDSPRFQQAFAGRYCLVVGVSHFQDPGIQNLRFANADARALHEYLVGRARIPAHNSFLLADGQATLAEIRSVIEAFTAMRLGKNDEVVIYFAGYGAWRDGRAYLLPYDADSERIEETAFPVSDLAALARETDGPRVTLILDAPLVSRFQGRSSADASRGEIAEALTEFLARPNHQVLSACRIGEGCVELEDLQSGLYTYYLLRGLAGGGDGNRDGEVTWEEASDYASLMVGEHAQIEGTVQQPGFHRGSGHRPTSAEEVHHP